MVWCGGRGLGVPGRGYRQRRCQEDGSWAGAVGVAERRDRLGGSGQGISLLGGRGCGHGAGLGRERRRGALPRRRSEETIKFRETHSIVIITKVVLPRSFKDLSSTGGKEC